MYVILGQGTDICFFLNETAISSEWTAVIEKRSQLKIKLLQIFYNRVNHKQIIQGLCAICYKGKQDIKRERSKVEEYQKVLTRNNF